MRMEVYSNFPARGQKAIVGRPGELGARAVSLRTGVAVAETSPKGHPFEILLSQLVEITMFNNGLVHRIFYIQLYRISELLELHL